MHIKLPDSTLMDCVFIGSAKRDVPWFIDLDLRMKRVKNREEVVREMQSTVT